MEGMKAIRRFMLSGVIRSVFFLFLFQASHVYGQQVEMSSSLNPVGSGARAVGMGGAFISVADDATAASWNPAGLVQLERPELSAVYSYFRRSQDYSSDVHPEISGTNDMDANGLNYASAVYPFVLFNRNMVVSLNYQRLYEMSKNVDFKYTWDMGGGNELYDDIKFSQSGYLYALSPAMAVQVSPGFYLGATLNLWGDLFGDNGWDNTYLSSATGTVNNSQIMESVDWREKISFKGTNAHLGFMWSPSASFTIGGVIKTPFDADLEKETYFSQTQQYQGGQTNQATMETKEDLTMQMPMSFGLGVSYRHSDKWTVALDIYRTQWSDFLLRDSKGNEINPIDGQPISKGRLSDTTQVRLGSEYLIMKENTVIPLRCGLFYDPEPTKDSPDDYYGFSLGAGYVAKKFAIDAAYQYRAGRDVSGDIPYIKGSSVDMNQHTFMMSVIYYF